MKNRLLPKTLLTVLALSLFYTQSTQAAVALDRTRIIFDGAEHAMSVGVRNDNHQLPYLAQAWLEDKDGNKIQSPLMALPPVQRLEPGLKSMVKIQLMPGADKLLPQDRESLFYFNLREIPPKSQKANVLQLALQTRVKLFYRPTALALKQGSAVTPWQEKLTLTRQGGNYQVTNPTPYYVTLVAAGNNDMKPVMVAPNSSADLGTSSLGNQPKIAYINDWGGRPVLTFSCSGNVCHVMHNKAD